MSELCPADSRVYLASQSPRRQALLAQIGVPFDVLALDDGDVAETPRPGEAPAAYVRRMARAKAIVGMRRLRQRPLPVKAVLGADTEVVWAGRIFGKPRDRRDAAAMLQSLSGKTHEVISAVALCPPFRAVGPSDTLDCTVATRVTFKTLRDTEIERYLDSGEPFGKAGAYAIQGQAGAFVTHLDGSYSGVVGLPLFETTQLLGRLNLSPAACILSPPP